MTIPEATRSQPRRFQVQRLEAGYHHKHVLFDVSVTMSAGVTVLAGPGGGGKSTFVRALFHNASQDGFWRSGQVQLPGIESRVQPQFPVPPGGDLATVLAAEAREEESVVSAARRVLNAVWPEGSFGRHALESHLEAPVESPGRWRHRLAAFTWAVSAPADLYVFDEPDADAPPEVLESICERIQDLAGAVLLVTHQLTLARRVADFVVMMADGRIVEASDRRHFFGGTAHPRARDYVRTGG